MDSNSLNLIQPVVSLQKPARVSETGRREQRRRKQARPSADTNSTENEGTVEPEVEAVAPETEAEESHTLDFRA